jgi:hypothetical protein
VLTLGTTPTIALASRSVRPGENFFGSFVPSSFAFSSFCSTSGVTTTLFEPRSFICSRISASAPLPMASMAITEATPNRMPSEVRAARSVLWPTASRAVLTLNRRARLAADTREVTTFMGNAVIECHFVAAAPADRVRRRLHGTACGWRSAGPAAVAVA